MKIEPPSTDPAPPVTSRAPRVALRPGHHLYPVSDASGIRSWRLAEPGDRFSRVMGPDRALERLRAGDHGAATAEVDTEHDQLRAAFAVRDLLHDGGPGHLTPDAGPRVIVSGDTPVAWLVCQLLAPWAEVTHNPVDGGSIDSVLRDVELQDVDVWITCGGWLRDTDFRGLERRCHDRGVVWQQCHVEGTSLFVGPLSVTGQAGYHDLRARRLAASTSPEELAAHWDYLERPDEPLPDVSWPPAGVIATAAGVLVEDVRQWWAARERPAGSDHVPPVRREHEIRTGGTGIEVRSHPVLPLPATSAVR